MARRTPPPGNGRDASRQSAPKNRWPMPARETGIVLAFVLAGGGCGTLARSAIDQIWPAQGWPWATFCINLLGTAVLAWLLTWLAGQGPETRLSSRLRQGVGTGLLGGFTTYSAFGVQVAERLPTSPWLATGYALGSLVGGMAAALVAARLTRLAMNRRQAS